MCWVPELASWRITPIEDREFPIGPQTTLAGHFSLNIRTASRRVLSSGHRLSAVIPQLGDSPQAVTLIALLQVASRLSPLGRILSALEMDPDFLRARGGTRCEETCERPRLYLLDETSLKCGLVRY
jgi:hypothetical protein